MENNQNKAPHTEPDILNPKRIVNKVISNWYFFLGAIIIGLLISRYITNNTTRIYSIDGTLLISEDQNSIGFDIFSSVAPGLKNTQLQNEIVYLKTYSLALKTIQSLDINVSYFTNQIWGYKPLFNEEIPIFIEANWNANQLKNVYFQLRSGPGDSYRLELLETENGKTFNRKSLTLDFDGNIPFDKIPSDIKGEFGKPVKTEFFEFTIFKLRDFSNDLFFKFSDDVALANSFKNLISIAPVNKEATVLEIKLNHPDRFLGRDYINSLMSTFLESDLELKNITAQQTLEFLEKQIVTINDSINIYENEIQNFRKINQITNISAKGENILSESVNLGEALNSQTLRSDYYNYLETYLENPEGRELLIPSVVGIEEPIINTMVSELIGLQNEKAGLSSTLIGNTFSYAKALNDRIENLRSNLRESVSNAIQNIDNQINRLESLIGFVEYDLNQLPEVEKKLISIERRYKINESIYTLLLEKKAETEIQKASTTTKHRVLDQAMINPTPISPNRSRNLALGVSLGISIPLFIIVLWSVFYHKITDSKELEEQLDIPILGTLPREKRVMDLLEQSSKSTSTESFRNIRSNLAIRFNFKNKGVILVTSTKSGEGKTYVSIKVASIYAALGKKTIILVMDLRRPRVHKELNLNNDKGVTTYLLQEGNDWNNFVQETTQENLFVLSAGPYLERSSELINTQKFEDLIAELKQEYDFVIIDTSPIGLVSETLELTKYADVNLFLFRQNFSFINQSQIANDLKNKFEIKNLFAIVNDVHKTGLGSYYGYGYGYGYEYAYKNYTDKDQSGSSRIKSFFTRKG